MSTLTFKQKRDYQAQIDGKYAEIEAGTLSFKEKRTIQAQINDIYDILGEGQDAAEKTTLDRLLAGEFNALSLDAYIAELGNVDKENSDLDRPTFNQLAVAVAEYLSPSHLQEIHNPDLLGVSQTDIDAELGKAA